MKPRKGVMGCSAAVQIRNDILRHSAFGVVWLFMVQQRLVTSMCSVLLFMQIFFLYQIYYILSPFCTVLKKMESLQDLSLSVLSKNIDQYRLRELCDIILVGKNSGVFNKGKLKAWDRRILDIFKKVRHTYSYNITDDGRCYYSIDLEL